MAGGRQTLSIRIPKEAVVDSPTVLTFTGTGVAPASAGHVVITAEPFSKATVVLQFKGSATFADNCRDCRRRECPPVGDLHQ